MCLNTLTLRISYRQPQDSISFNESSWHHLQPPNPTNDGLLGRHGSTLHKEDFSIKNLNLHFISYTLCSQEANICCISKELTQAYTYMEVFKARLSQDIKTLEQVTPRDQIPPTHFKKHLDLLVSGISTAVCQMQCPSLEKIGLGLQRSKD